MMNKDFDVMIAGGGIAGLSTWFHLNKYASDIAERTVLIEKETYPRDKVCGGALAAWSRDVLKNLDINVDIPSVIIDDIDFVYGDEKFTLHQPNQMQIIQRLKFDHLLAKTAQNRGLNLFQNEQINGFKNNNSKLDVFTNKGKYYVNTLVGADGANSVVAKKIRTSKESYLAPTIEIFLPINSEHESEFDEKKMTVDLSYIPKGLQGYVWHIPCIIDNKKFMCHGLADFRVIKNKMRINMKEILIKELSKRKIDVDNLKFKSYPIKWYSKDTVVSQSNVILVGDASGIEPAFGGGIHFSLSYGELAYKSIVNAFDNDDFSFSDYKNKIEGHLVGKFIRKCTKLAIGMYSGDLHPFNVAREIFTLPEKSKN